MQALVDLEARASVCTRCTLAATRTQVVVSRGNPAADLMFIGEAPGRDEDVQGKPFVGRSGQLLDRLVAEEMGLSDEGFYVCNTIKCRPPGNRDPLPEELASCRPWLEGQLDHVAPKVVVTLGNFATKLILQTTEGITKLRGRTFPMPGRPAITIVPTFHPAAVLRGGGVPMSQMRADLIRAKELL